MNISRLIKLLQDFKREHGDVPVVISSDSEGNEFGTLEPRFSPCQVLNEEADQTIGLALYPHYDHLGDAIEAVQRSGK